MMTTHKLLIVAVGVAMLAPPVIAIEAPDFGDCGAIKAGNGPRFDVVRGPGPGDSCLPNTPEGVNPEQPDLPDPPGGTPPSLEAITEAIDGAGMPQGGDYPQCERYAFYFLAGSTDCALQCEGGGEGELVNKLFITVSAPGFVAGELYCSGHSSAGCSFAISCYDYAPAVLGVGVCAGSAAGAGFGIIYVRCAGLHCPPDSCKDSASPQSDSGADVVWAVDLIFGGNEPPTAVICHGATCFEKRPTCESSLDAMTCRIAG